MAYQHIGPYTPLVNETSAEATATGAVSSDSGVSISDGNMAYAVSSDRSSSLQPRQRNLEEHSKNTPAAGRLPPKQPAEDFGHYVEGPRDKSGDAKPVRAAKIGHCSRETTSNGRPHHQDATWTTSQSRHVMDPRW